MTERAPERLLLAGRGVGNKWYKCGDKTGEQKIVY